MLKVTYDIILKCFRRGDGKYHCQPDAMQTHTTNHQAKKYTISYLIAKYEDRDTDKQ